MAKLSERVEERQARRARRPLPPSNPRPRQPEPAPAPVGADPSSETGPTSEIIDLRAGSDAMSTTTAEGSPSVAEPVQDVPTPAPAAPTRQINSSPNGGGGAGQRGKSRAPSQEAIAIPLEPRQVWLDQQNDLWLSECEYANVRRGGRKVISRSAVVRLALDQLRERMTPEQITDLLADREPSQPGRGRPRR